MRVGLSRVSVKSEMSVTSPVRKDRGVIRSAVGSSPVMPTREAEVLRHRLARADVVRPQPVRQAVRPAAEKKPSVMKRALMAVGALSLAAAGPALLSIVAIGPLGIAVAGGMAVTGALLIKLAKGIN